MRSLGPRGRDYIYRPWYCDRVTEGMVGLSFRVEVLHWVWPESGLELGDGRRIVHWSTMSTLPLGFDTVWRFPRGL